MKPIYWVLIILSATIIPLGLIILITRVILDPARSWWWTGGTLIVYAIFGLISTIIFLIIKLSKKKPTIQKIDADDAEERAKLLLLYDSDNPDNFIRTDRVIKKVGEAGKDRTPILWLMGKGSETESKIDILVDLTNDKTYPLYLFNKDDDYVLKTIEAFAENPEKVIREERVVGIDDFGRPATTIRTTKMSSAEKKEEEAKKEAEEASAF